MLKVALLFLIIALAACEKKRIFPFDSQTYKDLQRNTKTLQATAKSGKNNLGAAAPMIKGLMGVTGTLSGLYYAFYKATKSVDNSTAYPVIIWLGGGPGISSLLGNFLEIGPNKVVTDGLGTYSEAARDNSWADNYNLLFIDQPIGTGYSLMAKTTDIPTTVDQAIAQLYDVLTKFFAGVGELKAYAQSSIYIFGEDFSGKFIPALAKTILDQNANATAIMKLNLQGIGIGAPWVDPVTQIGEHALWAYSLGLIDENERKEIELYQVQALKQIKQGDFSDALDSHDMVLDTISEYAGGVSTMNYRSFTQPADFANIETYLKMDAQKSTYNTSRNNEFTIWNTTLLDYLMDDIMTSSKDKFSYVLEKIPVLIWVGQDSVRISTASAQTFLSKLKWSKQKDFNSLQFTPWIQKQTNVGLAKSTGGLTFVIVNNAGHFVPYEQPAAALDMLNRWIQKRSDWNDGSIQNAPATPAKAVALDL